MTEAEWSTCRDPDAMLDFASYGTDRHLLGVFGCACCRRVWQLLDDERSRRAVEVRKSFERGEATAADWQEALWPALAARDEARAPFRFAVKVDEQSPQVAGAWAAGAAVNASRGGYRVAALFAAKAAACASLNDWWAGFTAERAAQCDLLRDILGGQMWS